MPENEAPIQAFYDRLRAAGKPPKVARCAAARKLLHLAWALGTKQRRFDPDHFGRPGQLWTSEASTADR